MKTKEFFTQESIKDKIKELSDDLLLALDLQDDMMSEEIAQKIKNFTKIYFMVR